MKTCIGETLDPVVDVWKKNFMQVEVVNNNARMYRPI